MTRKDRVNIALKREVEQLQRALYDMQVAYVRQEKLLSMFVKAKESSSTCSNTSAAHPDPLHDVPVDPVLGDGR